MKLARGESDHALVTWMCGPIADRLPSIGLRARGRLHSVVVPGLVDNGGLTARMDESCRRPTSVHGRATLARRKVACDGGRVRSVRILSTHAEARGRCRGQGLAPAFPSAVQQIHAPRRCNLGRPPPDKGLGTRSHWVLEPSSSILKGVLIASRSGIQCSIYVPGTVPVLYMRCVGRLSVGPFVRGSSFVSLIRRSAPLLCL